METNKSKHFVGIAMRGFAMGIAEIIPGVSAGTLAFITGIYERLLNAISSFDLSVFKAFKSGGLKALWQKIDGYFLSALLVGMLGGIVFGVTAISYLLDNYPVPLWAFFFGLILASIFYIGSKVDHWSIKEIVLFILFAGLSYIVVTLTPSAGNESLIYVFFCGMIAISAMLLPGISGSFLLLILGMYGFIIQDSLRAIIYDFNFDALKVIVVFVLGCLTGMMTISKALSWTFKNYRNPTLAALSGIVLGSIIKIWPWRHAELWMDKITGEIITDGSLLEGVNLRETGFKIISEKNVWPQNYIGENYLIVSLVCMIIGILSVYFFSRVEKK